MATTRRAEITTGRSTILPSTKIAPPPCVDAASSILRAFSTSSIVGVKAWLTGSS